MAAVFDFDSYKLFLQAHLQENSRNRGYQARLAQAAGCQASYLNQALRTKVELTPDHGIRICQFLRLGPMETDYFLLLLQFSRASSPELKRHLSRKMNETRTAFLSLSRRVAVTDVPVTDNRPEYYSSWMFMAVHSALEVGRYSTAEALAKRFGLPQERVEKVLRSLESMGLARAQGGAWKPDGVDGHLPAQSYMNAVSHRNWRDRALQDIETQDPGSLHYTSVFTLSRTDAEMIRARLLQWIEDARGLIRPSPSEEVYCLLCDFFEA